MLRRLLREYLSLTRAERRGMQVLCLLIILLIIARASMPRLLRQEDPDFSLFSEEFFAFQDSLHKLDARMAAGNVKASGSAANSSRNAFNGSESRNVELFPFNPNTAGFDDLIRLGLPSRTARTLLNYRQAGGSFGSDSDLLKVYGMHPDQFSRLQPYIRISELYRENSPASDEVADSMGTCFDTAGAIFELNGADSQQLVSVYGIGPVFAGRIIRYRELLGGFSCTGQLLEVYGLSMQQYQELERRSFLDTTRIRKMDLNSADAMGLSRHPYLDRYQAFSVIAFREQMGPFVDPDQIIANRLIPDSVYRRIRPYLEVTVKEPAAEGTGNF